MNPSKRIGFTTSLPIEVLFAAGHKPIDLNNIFITQDPEKSVYDAEIKGFPRTICAWIKGNYRVALEAGLDEVINQYIDSVTLEQLASQLPAPDSAAQESCCSCGGTKNEK